MTVGELIAKLGEYPADMLVVIDDADTGWTSEQMHVDQYENCIGLRIEYGEMTDAFKWGRQITRG